MTVGRLAVAALALLFARGEAPLDALTALDTPNYIGGLTRQDRAMAARIHAAMAPRYTAVCNPARPEDGVLIGKMDDKTAVPPLASDDPDLAGLVRALDAPRQEVRDVAAYVIGLLGPSAKAALPTLEKRFGSDVGGWVNFAYGAVSCQSVAGADFRHTLPPSLLPPEHPWKDFLAKSARLMATLYLDPDIEYPPDMMGYAYQNYGLSQSAPVDLLARILGDGSLSLQKRREAAQALSGLPAENLEPARAALEQATVGSDADIRFYAIRPLVALHDAAAVAPVIETIGYHAWLGYWDEQLCHLGPVVIAAEDRLIDVATHSDWPSVRRRATAALGCIKSAKALGVLVPMLDENDWALTLAVATAIGRIGVRDAQAEAVLDRLAARHWSSKVREAAARALGRLGARPVLPLPPKIGPQIVVVSTGGPPPRIDHGLPWCNPKARYSLDGKRWFAVHWREPLYQPLPRGFHPKQPIVQTVGTQQFLQVPDGWLMGSMGFEDEGVLTHVARDGTIDNLGLGSGEATMTGFARVHGRILAFGIEIAAVGDGGVLFDITRGPDGAWHATRRLILPGFPAAHALSPRGELLLTDGVESYAVIGDTIVPLKCERTLGDYFAAHPQDPFVLRDPGDAP
jgi:HEAT repeat protein